MCDWITDREPTPDDLPNVHMTWATIVMRGYRQPERITVTSMAGSAIRLSWKRWYHNFHTIAWMPKPQPWSDDNDDETTKLAIALFERDDQKIKKLLHGERAPS